MSATEGANILMRAPLRKWVYIVPGVHFCFVLATLMGLMVQDPPTWSSRAWDFLYFVDFPVSLGMMVLGWGPKFASPAWALIACTWWWYFLSASADRLIQRFWLSKSV